jgi:ribosomal protein S18 acetylase RimI-like enzyme
VDEFGRVLEWLDDVAEGRAARTVAVPGGTAYLHPEYPIAHIQNFVRLRRPEPGLDADMVDRAVRDVFAGTAVDHRVVEVHDAGLAERLAPGLVALGYHHATDLVMRHAGDAGADETAGAGAARVVTLTLEERMEVATLWRRLDHPAWPKDWARQLGERIRTILPVAECTFLAVRDESGTVVSRADLFRRDGITQIEEVVTVPQARNRGYASELVLEGVRRAGTDLTIIIADADDWPAQLYRRLGFEDLGRTALFINAPSD